MGKKQEKQKIEIMELISRMHIIFGSFIFIFCEVVASVNENDLPKM